MTNIRNALGRLWEADDDANMLQRDGKWIPWARVARWLSSSTSCSAPPAAALADASR